MSKTKFALVNDISDPRDYLLNILNNEEPKINGYPFIKSEPSRRRAVLSTDIISYFPITALRTILEMTYDSNCIHSLNKNDNIIKRFSGKNGYKLVSLDYSRFD